MKKEELNSDLTKNQIKEFLEFVESPEALTKRKKYFFEKLVPTFMENWPKGFSQLSVPSFNLVLDLEEAKALAKRYDPPSFEDVDPKETGKILKKIEDAGDVFCRRFKEGVFTKLGSRSPKDCWKDIKPQMTGRECVQALLNSCERIFDDLCEAVRYEYFPNVWFRKWIDINRKFEFRCFMKDRQWLGASQYYYNDYFEELLPLKNEILQKLLKFFNEKFLPISHLDDVVFDVFLTNDEVKLIEINPFCNLTDPCLYFEKELKGDLLLVESFNR
jgi:hypothetical protein